MASLSYLAPGNGPVEVRAYPPNSGIESVRPVARRELVSIADLREAAEAPSLDVEGFSLHVQSSAFADYYDPARVRAEYYPEVRGILLELLGALEVVVFDHNTRSAVRSARGEAGVREPVDQVHNDYTVDSGPRRKQQILEAAGCLELLDHDAAFVNLWRPIVGPILDNPLALCDARSLAPGDLVPTAIQHFAESDLLVPQHRGEVYSVRHSPSHRWYYASAMQPAEFLLLKGYDSRAGRASFVPHTGFVNPACPAKYVPRESIEARTLVIFPRA